jgi:hypothetical protein
MWGKSRPESGHEPGLLGHRFVVCPRGVLLGTPARRIDEDRVGQLTAVVWQVWPAVLPEVPCFPPANAVLDGSPVINIVGEIPPGDPRASLIPHRFDAHPVMALRRAPGVVCHGPQDGFQFSPHGSGEHQTYGHRSFLPQAKFRGNPVVI